MGEKYRNAVLIPIEQDKEVLFCMYLREDGVNER